MIIDTRIRPPYKGFTAGKDSLIHNFEHATKWSGMFGGHAAPSVRTHSLDDCLAEMDAAGIDFAIAPGRKGQDHMWVDNQDVVDLTEDYPDRFAGIASIFPEDPMEYNLEQIKKYCIDGPLLGVSLETGLVADVEGATPRFVDDHKFWPIYELCEKHGVVVSFTHNAPAYPDTSGSDPVRLKHIYDDFPRLKTLLVHGCWPHVNEIAAYLFLNKNVMVQPDFYIMNTAGWRGYVDSANYMNPGNYVFASSYPLGDMSVLVDYYLNCGFLDHILPRIMYQNAADFFNLDASKLKRLPGSPVADDFDIA